METTFWKPQNGNSFTKTELESLKEQYDEAVYEYYQTDSTTMSDLQFDELKDILEANGYNLSTEDDVEDVNIRQKLTTENNMISLKKVQVFSEHFEKKHVDAVLSWLNQYQPLTAKDMVRVGWKLDGCASSLRYDENGNLYDVVTRGNFSIAKKMLEVAVKQHPTGLPNSEIRCEMIMRKSTFKEKYMDAGYANPRNLVSGIVNDQNVTDSRKWDVDFIRCNNGLNANEDNLYQNVYVCNNKLQYKTCRIECLPNVYETMKSDREQFDYPTDGIVVYIPWVKEFRHIGKYPLNSVAVKFPPVEAVTTVKEIQWNLKKSGEWIPKAILEPVDLDGSTVKRTLVFNYGFVVKNKVYTGAKVVIAKNGDIIPYIQRVVEPGDETRFSTPEDTIVSGIHLYPAENSTVVARERFIAGCYTLGIKNFGYAWFRGLAHLCNNDITQLFNRIIVNEYSLKQLFGGDKKVKAFISELYSISELSVYRVLRMMQIPGLGATTAMQIARWYSKISYSFNGLEKQVVNECISSDLIMNTIESLKEHGINVTLLVEDTTQYSATYEMTGSPKSFGYAKKSDFEKVVKNWKHTSLDKTTTYLITDDLTSTSSKMKKAQKNGTKILTYEQAVELYKSQN